MQNNNTKIILEFNHSIDYLHAMEKMGNKIKDAYEFVNHNLVKLCVIAATAFASFLPMKVEAQYPPNAIQYLGNPFVQPTDPEVSKNWYGSGDVNNDNVVDQNDVNRLEQVINGSFSDPSDRRLMNRSDVNWDGSVDISDKQILQEYINGTRDHLIGYWNELETREEKEELLQKFANVAQVDKICEGRPPSECNCNQRSEVTMLITNKWDATRDIPRFLEFDSEYDEFIQDTNLYNLPALQLDLQDNDGKFGHAYNSFVMGDNALLQSDRCDFESEFKLINSPIRSHSGDAMVRIRGYPTITDETPLFTDLGVYFK